jgi:hypothetical protein
MVESFIRAMIILTTHYSTTILFAGLGCFMKSAIRRVPVIREAFPDEKNSQDDNGNGQYFSKGFHGAISRTDHTIKRVDRRP